MSPSSARRVGQGVSPLHTSMPLQTPPSGTKRSVTALFEQAVRMGSRISPRFIHRAPTVRLYCLVILLLLMASVLSPVLSKNGVPIEFWAKSHQVTKEVSVANPATGHRDLPHGEGHQRVSPALRRFSIGNRSLDVDFMRCFSADTAAMLKKSGITSTRGRERRAGVPEDNGE